MFTIYGGLHPKSDVDKLYVLRKEGARGLISIEDIRGSNKRFGSVCSWKWGKIDPGCYRRQDRWFRSFKCFEEVKEK